MARKPGYHNTIVHNDTRLLSTAKRHSRTGYVSPGEITHILHTSGSPEVLRPRGTQGFGNLPENRPGLREIPYTTTVSSLRTNGVLFPQYPARAGVPSSIRGFTSTFRTLPNILCGLRKQAHNPLNHQIRSLIRLLVPRITLRTCNTTLFTTPDNYNEHISNSKYSPDESHNSSFKTLLYYVRSLQAPETN